MGTIKVKTKSRNYKLQVRESFEASKPNPTGGLYRKWVDLEQLGENRTAPLGWSHPWLMPDAQEEARLEFLATRYDNAPR